MTDDDRAIEVLHAAFDAGVDLVDLARRPTPHDALDTGHNERLIARALATWGGDRTRVLVATKGGLTRPAGRWMPDGRARHLVAACHASREALGVEQIALYQLHAPDSRVNWLTSVRALGGLARDGVIEAVGLCNVTVGQIEAARAVVDVATVRVELSPWSDRAVGSGVPAFCLAHGIRVLGFRPFGGVKGAARIARDVLLEQIAASHGATPFEIVLAWMRGFATNVVPLPGPTHVTNTRDVRPCRRSLTDGRGNRGARCALSIGWVTQRSRVGASGNGGCDQPGRYRDGDGPSRRGEDHRRQCPGCAGL